jgi:hypothetical protein
MHRQAQGSGHHSIIRAGCLTQEGPRVQVTSSAVGSSAGNVRDVDKGTSRGYLGMARTLNRQDRPRPEGERDGEVAESGGYT